MIGVDSLVWLVNDPQLNNAWVLEAHIFEDILDSYSDIDDYLESAVVQVHTAKPFLDKYGLVVELWNDDEQIKITNSEISAILLIFKSLNRKPLIPLEFQLLRT